MCSAEFVTQFDTFEIVFWFSWN